MLSFRLLLLTVVALLGAVKAEDDPKFQNTVYLIRNGETNTKKLGSGLSADGVQRAECLPGVFGPGTNRTVGYIIAEPPNKKGNKTEAVDTVTPLAQSLGLTIDTSCGRDDKDCVGDAMRAFAKLNPNTSMLVVWDTDTLPDIAEDLGANDVPDWPEKRHDLIWTVQRHKIRSKTTEGCVGLDDEWAAIEAILDEYSTKTRTHTASASLLSSTAAAAASGPSAPSIAATEAAFSAASAVTESATTETGSVESVASAISTPAFVVEGVLQKHGSRRRRSGASWAR